MLNFAATGKMLCDYFEAKKKKVSYICNVSDNNIVFVSQTELQFQGLNYFGHSLLTYSISS